MAAEASASQQLRHDNGALESLKAQVLPLMHHHHSQRHKRPLQGTTKLSLHIALESTAVRLQAASVRRNDELVHSHVYSASERRALDAGGWQPLYHAGIPGGASTISVAIEGHVIAEDGREQPFELSYASTVEARGQQLPLILAIKDARTLHPRNPAPVEQLHAKDYPYARTAQFYLDTHRALRAYFTLRDALEADTTARQSEVQVLLAKAYAVLSMPESAVSALAAVERPIDYPTQLHTIRTVLARDALAREQPHTARRHAQLVPVPIRDETAAADLFALDGRIALALGHPQAAAESLAAIPHAQRSSFTEYNRAIAHLRNDEVTKAASILAQLGHHPARTEAERSLRDRAHLLLGQLRMEARDPIGARRALERVQLRGPYANEALLGMGWVSLSGAPPSGEPTFSRILRWLTTGRLEGIRATKQRQQEHMRRALHYWESLSERDPIDPVVQEAMLASAYLLQQTGKRHHARQRYAATLAALQQARERLAAGRAAFEGDNFLATLARTGDPDRFGSEWEVRGLPDVPATYWLPALLSHHGFQSVLRDYRDLTLMEAFLQSIPNADPKTDIDVLLQRAQALRQRQGNSLRAMAMTELDRRSLHLEQHLARARLAMARMNEPGAEVSAPSDTESPR